MNNLLKDNKTKFIAAAVVLAALSRVLPHPYNFTPIGAIALFGGTYLKDKKVAFILPLAVLLFTDLILQMLHPGYAFYKGWLWVYGGFALIIPLGFYLRKRVSGQNIAVASLTGSIIFFIITNFGMWIGNGLYPVTSAGLADCYMKAIPFFGGTVIGDLVYNSILFGVYALAKWRFPFVLKESN